ncbi:MAG: ammonium transporter, partial [Gammaproteobacteria bacterium]
MKKRIAFLLITMALGGASLFAQAAPDLAKIQSDLADARTAADNSWMLVSCALVLLMTGPGLALFYGG